MHLPTKRLALLRQCQEDSLCFIFLPECVLLSGGFVGEFWYEIIRIYFKKHISFVWGCFWSRKKNQWQIVPVQIFMHCLEANLPIISFSVTVMTVFIFWHVILLCHFVVPKTVPNSNRNRESFIETQLLSCRLVHIFDIYDDLLLSCHCMVHGACLPLDGETIV